MRLIVENRFALFGLVALALAALFGVAHLTGPLTAEVGVSEAETVRPDRAVRVCPRPSDGSDADSVAAAFAPRVSRDDGGELWAVPVPGTPDEDDLVGEQITEPGLVWSAVTSGADAPTAVHAADDLASGLEAAQVTSSEDTATEVLCAQPSISTWFALPGGDDPEGVDLDGLTAYLSNPETTAPPSTSTSTRPTAPPTPGRAAVSPWARGSPPSST